MSTSFETSGIFSYDNIHERVAQLMQKSTILYDCVNITSSKFADFDKKLSYC